MIECQTESQSEKLRLNHFLIQLENITYSMASYNTDHCGIFIPLPSTNIVIYILHVYLPPKLFHVLYDNEVQLSGPGLKMHISDHLLTY